MATTKEKAPKTGGTPKAGKRELGEHVDEAEDELRRGADRA